MKEDKLAKTESSRICITEFMDLRRLIVCALFILNICWVCKVSANVVFRVQHKYGGDRSLSAYKAHDALRHGRILASVDLPLGGNGQPSETGLYFAKIGLGSPSKDYYVQVDTGSDILWVNCVGCTRCPKKSDIGIELTLYDPKSSKTSNLVACNEEFCTSTYNGQIPGCRPELLCQYNVEYGDGSSTAGYFVQDILQYNRASGNLQTAVANGTVVFGCGARQSGELGSSSEALDGILGFGQANSSLISQLASAGKVKKMFSHCLDGVNGGGIFAIGELVQPKLNTTPLVPNQAHYNVNLKTIEVGGHYLDLPTDVFDTGDGKGTIIDSGTTLAYLPEAVYDPLLTKVMSNQPGVSLHTVEQQFKCFQYTGNVDDGFPDIKFHFENSLSLTVYPREYLFQIREDAWCIGWQNGNQSKEKGMTLLGDIVLSNKLVFYDLVNQGIGITEYNCSSSIKVKDEQSGAVYSVGAHYLSSASNLSIGKVLTVLLSLIVLLHNFIF